ncbi:16S rRNA (guanine(527)-N(7))-methyltransferase RsmG [Rhodobacteraceae bacterium N5(2021)]|uniref:Ribosomal RNA small subunit methyltransferase G n=1 Tax=Gymnodinialimonas phycosphaerae TaxID=2841589 RepID=A0A975YF31_9RHOB|nr:16S rRNA (guanine(527)-N(7))-methyltransferase RsmG [Gymnodinialimonas phycosphaerae]MBY4894272.1 16S rRNA (guanine(527)-N(7))-methyltransferase RsmG [Gymnodinialimonas phycosphaerae]
MNADHAKAWIAARVSRETMERLELFLTLLHHWQKTINLVAPSTLDAAWSRHFLDSAQIYDLAPQDATRWLDLGSGGGFPGLVVATLARETRPDLSVTLVESDIRKCGFMREAARKMDVPVKILTRRIADIPPQAADVISARALSSLSNLIDHAKPHMTQNTCLLFPKGSSYKAELETLSDDWQIKGETIASLTDPDAVVLRFQGVNTRKEC